MADTVPGIVGYKMADVSVMGYKMPDVSRVYWDTRWPTWARDFGVQDGGCRVGDCGIQDGRCEHYGIQDGRHRARDCGIQDG